jgi:hypothetical protein
VLALVFVLLAPTHFRSFSKAHLRNLGCRRRPLAPVSVREGTNKRVLIFPTVSFRSDRPKDLASQISCDSISRASVSVWGAIYLAKVVSVYDGRSRGASGCGALTVDHSTDSSLQDRFKCGCSE